jgi:hypothetical protein
MSRSTAKAIAVLEALLVCRVDILSTRSEIPTVSLPAIAA